MQTSARNLTYDGSDDGASADADDVVEQLVHLAAGESFQAAQQLDGDDAADAAAVQRQDARPARARHRRVPHQRQRLQTSLL